MARKINKIVIHYSASQDVPAFIIDRWHSQRGWNGIGYHRVVRKDGFVEPGRGFDLAGAHAKWNNSTSLGVVLTGADTIEWYPTEKQYQSLKNVILNEFFPYAGKAVPIFFHRELNKTLCPGRLDKNRIIQMINEVQLVPIPIIPPIIKPKPQIIVDPQYPTIGLRDRGRYVIIAQQRLHAHHTNPGDVDGIFGRKTKKAVIDFQRFIRDGLGKRDMIVDGIIGKQTWHWLLRPAGK